MAAYQARSNVCRSGVTYAGLTTRTFGLTIGGVNRLNDTRQSIGWTLTTSLDGRASLTLTCGGTAPAEGADVLLTLGGELLFGGTLQKVRSIQRGQLMAWDCVATDWWWLLDRFARVTGRFTGGANVIVHRLLAQYTNGGFLPGYLPSSLGDLDLTFEDETVGECLLRIAKASNGGAGAFLRITPYKRIDIATSFPDGVSLTLVDGSPYRASVIERSIDQIRTRVQARGEGSQTTALVPANATELPVAECGIYAASGTVWVAGLGPVAYTGRSAASGPGSLTGVTGLTVDVAQGALVQVYALVNDATAQTSLATRLGSGRSGVAVYGLVNESWSQSEVLAMAGAHLALLKDPMAALMIEATARPVGQAQTFLPGAVLAASQTTPQAIAGDFRLQQVRISQFGPMVGTEPYVNVVLDARSTVGIDLFDLLGTLS